MVGVKLKDVFRDIGIKHLSEFVNFIESPKGFRFELINESHTRYILKWRNDINRKKFTIENKVITEDMQNEFLNTYYSKDRLDFVLVYSKTNEPVGVFALKNISTQPELGKIIGEEKFRGRGLAKLATRNLLDFAFNVLQLKKIVAKTQKNNIRNIKLNEVLGFIISREEKINSVDYYIMELSRAYETQEKIN